MANTLESPILHPPVVKATKQNTPNVPDLADASKVFKAFIEQMPKDVEDFGCNIAVLGSPGCGKSCTVFAMAFGFAAYNPEYWVQIYRMKKSVIDFIKHKFTSYYTKLQTDGTPYDVDLYHRLESVMSRIEVIKKMKHRRDMSIVICDEAALCMDVYSYQKAEAKSIVQQAAISRHQSAIVFACCQDNVLNKNFLSKSALWLYKNLSEFYMRRMADEWEKDYKSTLLNLAKDKRLTVFRNTLDYLTMDNKGEWNGNGIKQEQGFFELDFRTYMPFWDGEMSHMWKKFGMIDDVKDEEIVIMKMAKKIYNELNLEKEFLSAAKGLFRTNDWLQGTQDYADIKHLIPESCYVAKFWRDNTDSNVTKEAFNKLREIERVESKSLEIDSIEPSMTLDEMEILYNAPKTQSFPEFISQRYAADPFKANIFYKYLSGTRQEKLRKGKGAGKVPMILNNSSKTIMGYDFEDYINQVLDTGYSSPHNQPLPDAMFRDHIMSIKCQISAKNYKEFDIEEEFSPERNYCIAHGISSYHVIYYNPFWGDSTPRYIILETNACGPIRIKKADMLFIPEKYRKEFLDSAAMDFGDELLGEDNGEDVQEFEVP